MSEGHERNSPSLTRFEVALLSREVAAAYSCGRQPAENRYTKPLSPEGAAQNDQLQFAVAPSGLKFEIRTVLRADARSYMLSSLTGL